MRLCLFLVSFNVRDIIREKQSPVLGEGGIFWSG
jgi:hypothetical protein